MKVLIAASCLLLPVAARCQSDSSLLRLPATPTPQRPHSVIATAALGFIDGYRLGLPVPAGYSKSSISGFAPLMARVEYTTGNISFGVSSGYDAFLANLGKQYEGNNGAFTRYISSSTRIFSLGISGFYHFRHFLPSQFDPFIGASIFLNNIRCSAWPQGDTTAVKIDHSVNPALKVGTRYYLSHAFSLYADAGYDKHAVADLGFSVRFSRHHSSTPAAPAAATKTVPDTPAVATVQRSLPRQPEAPQPVIQQPTTTTPVPMDTDRTGIADEKDHIQDRKNPSGGNSSPVAAQPAHKELVLPITSVQFQLNKASVSPSSLPALDRLADLLRDNTTVTLLIDGYADTTGTEAINDRISLARAQCIKKYLIKKGISSARLIARGHGSHSPVASNRTKAGRAKDRRVALKLK